MVLYKGVEVASQAVMIARGARKEWQFVEMLCLEVGGDPLRRLGISWIHLFVGSAIFRRLLCLDIAGHFLQDLRSIALEKVSNDFV